MAFDNDQNKGPGQPQRQMTQGNWTCGACGTAITQLPFDPDPARLDSLRCRDCHQQRAQQRQQQQMYDGEWECGECGAAISQLPFQPDPDRLDELLCRDCHRAQRVQ